jgi:hypothetical protein
MNSLGVGKSVGHILSLLIPEQQLKLLRRTRVTTISSTMGFWPGVEKTNDAAN